LYGEKMTIYASLCQLFQKILPPPQPQDGEAGPQPFDLEVVRHNMVNFCLAWAPAIALTYAQVHSKFSPVFHVVSFEFLLCFATLLVSKFMKPKFPVIAQMLDLVGVFFGVTAFFTVITIPFPLCLQIIAWVVYAITFLAVLVSTLF
jgi:hypothetical protein